MLRPCSSKCIGRTGPLCLLKSSNSGGCRIVVSLLLNPSAVIYVLSSMTFGAVSMAGKEGLFGMLSSLLLIVHL